MGYTKGGLVIMVGLNTHKDIFMLDRAIGIAGLALAILSIVGPKMFPDMNKKIAVAGFILGILLLRGAGATLFLPSGKAQPSQQIQYSPSINGNCNATGNNNSLCNTYGSRRLTFSNDIASKLLEFLPDKKPVRITAIGSPSDQAVADQYAAFLKVSGYEILPGNYIGMTNMMPEKQITIGKAPDHYEITIAPSVF